MNINNEIDLINNNQTLDNQELEERIGKGATSTSYKAIDNNNNDYVCIKLYNKNNPQQERELILQILNHPNIVTLFNCSKTGELKVLNNGIMEVINNNCLYFALEYCIKGELFDQILKSSQNKNGGFPERICRQYFKQILLSMKYLHDNNLIHRDLKFENIVLDNNQNSKLIDFGCCMQNMDNLTDVEVGTPGYLAPEILKKHSQSGKKVDIFSLGICLFILVVGRPPFQVAHVNNRLWRMLKHAQNHHKQWEEYSKQANLSDDFKDLIQKILTDDPYNRYTIDQILEHQWIHGDTATNNEVRLYMQYLNEL